MLKVDSLLESLDLKKWVVKSEFDVIINDSFSLIYYRVHCENEYWTWIIDLVEDPDYKDGYLGIRYLYNKLGLFENKLPNCFTTGLWYDNTQRDNIIFLLNCVSLDDMFNKKFSYLEELEIFLKRNFIIKIPLPLRESEIWVSTSFNNYRIELYDMNNKEKFVLIPLCDEDEDDVKGYSFHSYRFKHDKKYKINYNYNTRNMIKWESNFSIPVIKYEKISKDIIITLLCIQKYYMRHIDKNVFIKIIKELRYILLLDDINKIFYF